MNLFTDAYYRCGGGCGRLSLFPNCSRCVDRILQAAARCSPKPWPDGIEWNESGRCCLSCQMGIVIWIGRDYPQMWEVWCEYEQFKYGTFDDCTEAEAEAEKYRAQRRAALRSVIEEAKVTYAEAGVFDVYQEWAGSAWGLLFFAQRTDEPLKNDAEPLLRVRRIPESIKERWREVPLPPLVTKANEQQEANPA